MSGSDGIDRRAFLKGTGGLLVAAGMDARSYARIPGAMTGFVWGSLGAVTEANDMCTWFSLRRSSFPSKRLPSAICGASRASIGLLK